MALLDYGTCIVSRSLPRYEGMTKDHGALEVEQLLPKVVKESKEKKSRKS